MKLPINKPISAPTPAEAKPAFDKAALQAKLDAVTAYYQQYEGRPGYNPFFYLIYNVKPLKDRLIAGETTPELASAIYALVRVEPTV